MAAKIWRIGYRARRTWVAYFVALVGLAVTAVAAAYVARATRDKDQARYESTAWHMSDSIQHSIDTYIAILQGGAGLFAAYPSVTREVFQSYVARMELSERFRGVQGVGFAERVARRDRQAFVERMRRAGIKRLIPGAAELPFDIWTLGADQEFPEQYPIVFLEEMDRRNKAAIGFDMFSDPVRREAMERARDLGRAAASGKVRLVQEIDEPKQAGFLIYVPVYRGGRIPESVAERRALILGYVYSPFRADDLLRSVSQPEGMSGLDFSVYDGTQRREEDRIYSSGAQRRVGEQAAAFTSISTVDVAGRQWTALFASNARFESSSGRSFIGWVGFWGALITFLLFIATRSQARARATAEDGAAELRASELALRLSEARARRLFESSLIGIVYWDVSGRIVDANEAFLELVQYSPEDLEAGALTWSELTPGEYVEADARSGLALATEGMHAPYEKEFFRKGGGRVPVLVGNARVEGSDGLNVGFVVDLSERRRAEQAERASEERLRLTADAVPALISYIDDQARYRLTNRAFEEWFGFSREQAYGKPMRAVLGDDNYARLEPHLRMALSGRPVNFEARLDTRGGRKRDIQGAYIPDLEPNGSVRGLVGFINDITDRKQAEEERSRLLAREREARSEAETLNRIGRSLSAELDIDKLVQGLTDAATMLTGARFGAFLQMSPSAGGAPAAHAVSGDFSGSRSPEWWGRLIPAGVSLGGDPVRMDEPVGQAAAAGGAGPAIRSHLSVPVRSRAGEVFGALLVGHTEPSRFTEHHERILNGIAAQAAVALDNARLYRSNEEARQEAVAANRTKDEFLAIVSHELRTPLNAILGWAHLLRQGRLDPEQSARGIETIERNARAQAQLIGDLLDVSRIVSGKLRLERQEVNLCSVVEAAIETVAPESAAKGVRVESNLDPVAVVGDPGRLQQVVWNLLSNAIKFTPSGGSVQVTLSRGTGSAEIRVADTGSGIPANLLPHIFDRFRQGESSSMRKHGGLGLGLAIVRNIVELHEGTVQAASAGEGKGSEFTVNLPVSRTQAAPPDDVRDAAPGPVPLNGLRALVVEDERDARDLVSVALEHAGARVLAVDSAARAFVAVRTFRPDVVISDIGMPGEDGYALLGRIRAASELVPAVALTAFAGEEDRHRAMSAGFQAHIAKPVDPERLILLVARLTGRDGPAEGAQAPRR